MSTNGLARPFQVAINSTCSGAWPVIYEPCMDEKEGEWNREVARTNTAFVETAEHRQSDKAATWNEDPSAFQPTENSAEEIATAYLLAAAPTMADALRAVALSPTAPQRLKALARAALAVTEVPAALPQADAYTQ